jgi:hypothetical protein
MAVPIPVAADEATEVPRLIGRFQSNAHKRGSENAESENFRCTVKETHPSHIAYN